MKHPQFSIIIPIRVENDYLRETLAKLKLQSYNNFEVLVITDKISKTSDPSCKRNLGAKKAVGDYLAFLDDDSYPHKNWLNNAAKQITLHPQYSAFCGPCLTPPSDSIYQKASGLVWGSILGSGGAGTYRNSPQSARFVQDYPTVNLIVKKSDFLKINGFQSKYWPGEDTILCLDIITKLNKKIYYHPSIVVFHHRRNVIIPHLQQIKRYALHRGLFARKFPQTSFKLGYLLPSIFLIYILLLPFLPKYYLYPLFIYLSLLLTQFSLFILNKNNLATSFIAAITIPLTHLFYGILFLIGFFSFDLTFKPHSVDSSTGKYLGG